MELNDKLERDVREAAGQLTNRESFELLHDRLVHDSTIIFALGKRVAAMKELGATHFVFKIDDLGEMLQHVHWYMIQLHARYHQTEPPKDEVDE